MFTIRLAEHNFVIDNKYGYVEELCKDYIIDNGKDGQVISITPEETAFENKDGGNWKEDYLEALAVYRKICETLLDDDILLFHCSSLRIDGKAYLFTAPSGTGKSTHTGLWRKYFGNRVTMINDDKPLLSFGGGQIIVYGTPYAGKDFIQNNISAPVAGIVILHQAPENTIRRLDKREAYPMLLNQTYRKNDPEGMIKTMNLVERLAQIPVYEMGCTISEEAVKMSYDALTEGR